MTRKEEIIRAAIKEFPRFAERRVGFIAGAEWADANPDRNTFACISLVSAEQAKKLFIDKACEYLASNMRCDGYTTQTKAKFIQSLKKAMEE